jgi:hypothetical protein
MCFPKPNVQSPEQAAAETERLEAERAERVRATSSEVNRTFDERFGPSYYKGIGDSFRNYYKPQIEDQFRDAGRSTKLRFADIAGSSAANRTTADLYRDKLRADSNVETGASDAQQAARSDVEGKRAQLIGMAEAGGSMENTAALARGAVVQPPTFSPIGDLFSKYANALQTTARAGDSGYATNPFMQKQVDFLRGRSGGSQRIVG